MTTFLIKLLCTAGFILLCWLYTRVGGQNTSGKNLKNVFSSKNFLSQYLKSASPFIISFLQFCVLSVTFHYKIALFTVGVLAATAIISYLLTSLTGLMIKEKYEKVQKLAFSMVFFNALSSRFSRFYTNALGLFMLAIWGISIIFLWIKPLHDPNAGAWFAILTYIPYIIAYSLMSAVITNSYLSSENTDDDLRNYQLVQSFASIFSSIFIFVIPYVIIRFLLRNDSFPLPTFWWFILVPLGLLVIFILIPYFIGSRRYSSQVSDNNTWLSEWMKDSLNVLNFPDKELQEKEINEKLTLMHEKIKEKNEEEYTQRYKALIEDPSNFIPRQPGLEYIFDFYKDNREKLLKWDTSISYLEKLGEVNKMYMHPDKASVKEYLKYNIDAYKNNEARKNSIVGYAVTIISGLSTFIYKFFESDINKHIKDLFS